VNLRTIFIFTQMIICFLTLPALAGGPFSYQNYLIGSRAAGMGGATAAFGHDSSAPYINPAGLGRIEHSIFSLSINTFNFAGKGQSCPEQIGNTDSIETCQFGSSSFFNQTTSLVYGYNFKNDPAKNRSHLILMSIIIPDHYSFSMTREIDRHHSSPQGEKRLGKLDEFTSLKEQTYWIGPTYASRFGQLYLGISLFFLYHIHDNDYKLSLVEVAQNGNGHLETSGKVVAANKKMGFRSGHSYNLASIFGLQYDWKNISLGTSLRLSSYQFSGQGRVFEDYSDLSGDLYNIKEISGGKYQYQLPARLTLGIGYRKPEQIKVALDLQYFFSLSQYLDFPSQVKKLSIQGNDNGTTGAGSVIHHPGESSLPYSSNYIARKAVLNFNLGCEYHLGRKYLLRAGAFSNFSSARKLPEEVAPQQLYQYLYGFQPKNTIDQWGGTLGFGYIGHITNVDLGVMFAYGRGDTLAGSVAQSGAREYRPVNMEEYRMIFFITGSFKPSDLLKKYYRKYLQNYMDEVLDVVIETPEKLLKKPREFFNGNTE